MDESNGPHGDYRRPTAALGDSHILQFGRGRSGDRRALCADAIASLTRWAGVLTFGDAVGIATEVRFQMADLEMLRVLAARALDVAFLRSDQGLPRFLSERHRGHFAQTVSYRRLRREAATVLELLDATIGET